MIEVSSTRFFLSGNKAALERRTLAYKDRLAALAKLRELNSDDPNHQAMLADLHEASNARYAISTELIDQGLPSGFKPAINYLENPYLEILRIQLISSLDALDAKERALLNQRLGEQDLNRKYALVMGVLLVMVMIAFIAMAYWFMIRQLNASHQAKENAEAAHDQAARADQAKGQFLSSMSHELRTPLNAILGFTQMSQIEPGLSERLKENLGYIYKAGRHLLNLINEVLDLTKIDAGKMDVSLEPVELQGVLDECRELVTPLLLPRQVTLLFEPAGHCVVRADRMRLKQILINLLSNAIKYNRERGQVHLRVIQRDGRVVIEVADTGVGIAAKHMGKLFQPFTRVEFGSSFIEGTGIGLSIAQRLAELMGGSIAVQSEVGQGSCFSLSLPESQPVAPQLPGSPVPELPPTTVSEPSAGAAQLILSIDDNPMNHRLVRQVLGLRPNTRMIEATSPSQGLAMASEETPALILLDISMPEMDGYAVLRLLRADPRTAKLPVLAITANAMPNDKAQGLAAGFDDYLTKPLDIPAFLAALDRFLK